MDFHSRFSSVALVVALVLAQKVASADPVPVVVVTDTATWLGHLKELRSILPRRNDVFADPLAGCGDATSLAASPGTADRVALAFVTGARLAHAAEGAFTDVAPGRLGAVRPLIEALRLPQRNDENDAERDALDAVDAVRRHPDVPGFVRLLDTVRARLEDVDVQAGEAFTAGMILARLFGSLEVGDDNGRLDAITHVQAWLVHGADAPKPLRGLFDSVIRIVAGPDVDAGRLNQAVGVACRSLGVGAGK
jgi:hypothetical protein